MVALKELPLAPPTLGAEERDALARVIDSGWITMGECVGQFEEIFAAAHGIEHGVAVSSATAGLHLALAACGIGEGDEVIVPALTFVSTANAALHAGGRPVLAEIESIDRPLISLEDVQRRITTNTRAIVVVHYGGWLCPMKDWRALADKNGLKLIEDAAHAPGMNGVGRHSDAAVFSFYGNKNMTTAEGGMVLTRDEDLAGRIRRLRSHAMTTLTLDRHAGHAFSYDVTDLGYNFRIDELRAALGLVQLERLAQWNDKRRELVGKYRDAFNQSNIGIRLPFNADELTSGHLCPALLPEGCDRQRIMSGLREEKIHSSVHYPPIHRFSFYRELLGEQRLPVTEEFTARELSLPLHPALTHEDVDRVVSTLASLLEAGK